MTDFVKPRILTLLSNLVYVTCVNNPKFIVSNMREESIIIYRVNFNAYFQILD